MLKWFTIISLVLTLLVGVLSALFKTVQEREITQNVEGKHQERKWNQLPTLTGWGWGLLVALFMLCLTSIILVFISSTQAEENDRKTEATQKDLTTKLSELSRDNEELRKGNSFLNAGNIELRKLAGLNFDKLVQSQQEDTNRHIQSLNRFSSLITREESIGRNTAPVVDRLSFTLAIPGDQKVASAFLKRIDAVKLKREATVRVEFGEAGPIALQPGTALFPDPNEPEERELYQLLTFVRVRVDLFRQPVEVQFGPHVVGIGQIYEFRSAPSFSALVDAPIIPGIISNFGIKQAEGQQVAVRYDAINNLIVFEGNGLRNLFRGLTTWDDLANYYVVVTLFTFSPGSSLNVSRLTLISSAETRLETLDFKPFHPERLSYFFLGRIPADTRWK